ncbi:MAG TPA: hypothetical protein VHM90_20520 [Phycisphaerae bacterium]|nr:hypothetical protein [Phycisphaerae bacterium]
MKRGKEEFGGEDFFNEMDITQALHGWAFEPGQVNVRLIRGNDGKPKLQLRLDLGLLQMELDGRPDGKRPHRAPTELEYQSRKLANHTRKNGSDAGFALTGQDCSALREESAMFYHRYLSLFVLEQYEAVIRDTQHNLDVLDMCHKFGKSEYDRMCLEQYRPYIMMMNVRARACEALRKGYVQTAVAYLRGGIKQITRMVPREHRRQFLRESNEARILLDMLKQIRSQLPADPRDALRKKLKDALRLEKYEEAALLRDQLNELVRNMANPASKAKREADSNPGSASLPPEMPKTEPVKKPRKRRAKKEEE